MKIKSATPAETEEGTNCLASTQAPVWNLVGSGLDLEQNPNCSECVPSLAGAADPPQLGGPISNWDGQQGRKGCRSIPAAPSLPFQLLLHCCCSIPGASFLCLHSCQSTPASASLQFFPCRPSLGFHPRCSIPAAPSLPLHPPGFIPVQFPALQLGGLGILLKQSHTSG